MFYQAEFTGVFVGNNSVSHDLKDFRLAPIFCAKVVPRLHRALTLYCPFPGTHNISVCVIFVHYIGGKRQKQVCVAFKR